MYRAFRHILLLLVAVAIVGGTTTELARAAQYGVIASGGMPCEMAMPTSATDADQPPMEPCKGMTPDCIKLMGCVVVNALPAQFLIHQSTVRYSAIDYWAHISELASSDLEPEPLPPRTI